MEKMSKAIVLAAAAAIVMMFTSCLSAPEPVAAEPVPRTNDINKVTFCAAELSVEGSKSFTLKMDEVDAAGNVVTSNVIFPTMVSFSSSYHKRDFNVNGKMLPGRSYKVIITTTNNAVPIEIEGAETYVLEAKGGYDYSVEYHGKGFNAAGKEVYTFSVTKEMN